MRCPKCGCLEDKVVDSRMLPEEDAIRRRRQCTACDYRFTTREEIVKVEMRVLKRDGRREEFNKLKLEDGLLNACQKRPVTTSTIRDLINKVEADLIAEGKDEITSEHIGELVMENLKELDDVAYVRFASVYWRFDDLNQFVKAVREMTHTKRKE